MRRGLSILNRLCVTLGCFALWACSGATGPASLSPSSPNGVIQTPTVGSGQFAQPGMEEVALGTGADPTDIRLALTCYPGNTAKLKAQFFDENQQAPDEDISDTLIQSVPNFTQVSFTLKMTLNMISGITLRVVDLQSQEYRQSLTDSQGSARIQLKKKNSQQLEFFSASLLNADTSGEPKTCTATDCNPSDMKKLNPCMQGDSCAEFGFNLIRCEDY